MSSRFSSHFPSKLSAMNDRGNNVSSSSNPNHDKMRKPFMNMNNFSWSLLVRRLLLKAFFHRKALLTASFVCLVSSYCAYRYRLPKTARKYPPRSVQGIPHQYLTHHHPRIIQRYDHEDYLTQHELELSISYDHHPYATGRIIHEWTEKDEQRQKDLWDENHYDIGWIQPFTGYEDQPNCQPMHEWQLHHSPTCNALHEQSLRQDETYKYLASGWYRSTFEIYDSGATIKEKDDRDGKGGITTAPVAMKTMKMKEGFFIPNLLNRHRVDALIYEKTTASKYIMDMYAYCAYSGLYQYASGGTLMDYSLREKGDSSWSKKEILESAIEVASSMADLHTIESRESFAAMSHTDIMLDQWLWTDEGYKLNDFNRGHLMYWNENTGRSCPYHWNENNPGYFRAPEEYKMEEQTEKIDVFSLGNALYSILTGLYPFDFLEMEDAQKMVIEGETPPLSLEYRESDHPVDMALVQAMEMCWTYKWQERASASNVRDILVDVWKKMEYSNDSKT